LLELGFVGESLFSGGHGRFQVGLRKKSDSIKVTQISMRF
jgi:hypothetical protein